MNDLMIPAAVSQSLAPRMTPALKRAVESATPSRYGSAGDGDPGFVLQPVAPSQSVRLEAQMVLDVMAAQPMVDMATLRVWLLPLITTTKGAPASKEELAVFASAAAPSFDHLPAAVCCAASSKLSVGRFKFWPTPPEILTLLEEFGADWLAARKALKAVAGARDGSAPGEAERPVPTEEERAAVRRAAQEAIAALQGVSVPRSGP